MHILLTDLLACPRCGPEFGLVLLADRVEDRRVLEGRLGCPNCREQYPVVHGALDARLSTERGEPIDAERPSESVATAPADDVARAAGDAEAAVRLAALLGLADARGTVLVAGPGAALAPAIAALVPELEVVALQLPHLQEEVPAPDEGRVSRVAAGAALPFRSRTLRGVAMDGGAEVPPLAEAVRVLQPGGRLVVERAPAGTAERVAALGARVMLDQEGTVVAGALGDLVQPRLNAVR